MKKLNPKIGKLTFDQWVKLATDNPQDFEIERNKAVQDQIMKLPEKRRLKLQQFQFRIDSARRKYKNMPYVYTEVLIHQIQSMLIEMSTLWSQLFPLTVSIKSNLESLGK